VPLEKGLFEVLTAFELLASLEPDLPTKPFEVEIVASRDAPSRGASGLPIAADRSVGDADRTDIAIVPLMMVAGADWKTGRYPDIVDTGCNGCIVLEPHCVRRARVTTRVRRPSTVPESLR
jgi:hypothetical protein